MMACDFNLFIYTATLVLVHTHDSAAQSKLEGPNICTRINQFNRTINETSVHLQITDNKVITCDNEICTRTIQNNTVNTFKIEVNHVIFHECCDGFVESSDKTNCVPKYGILNYLVALAGILLLIAILVSYLCSKCCRAGTRTTDISSYGKHAIRLEQKTVRKENTAYPLLLENDDSSSSTHYTSLTVENRTVDQHQSWLNQLQTTHDVVEAGHLMESGIWPSTISRDDNKSSFYESVASLNSNATSVKNTTTEAKSQEHIYDTLDLH